MITTTEERPHPLITALTAANAGQGGLNEAVADAVDIMLSDNKCVDWTLLWDYQDDRFVLEPVFGRTIYLAFFSTSHLGRAAKAARANKDKEELLRLQIKAVKARLKRDRLDLMQRHVCKEALTGIWLHYHTGYFEPEWLLEQKPEYLFRRDETFKHLLRIGAVQMVAGRSLLNPDAPELSGHPAFEELVARFSELILDSLWEKKDIEQHTRLELHYYALRFGPEAVLDGICERAISHSMLTGHNAISRELNALCKISALLEDLQGVPRNSEWLNKLLERFELLKIWGWRVRDKEKWPDLTQSLLYEVERIRQLA